MESDLSELDKLTEQAMQLSGRAKSFLEGHLNLDDDAVVKLYASLKETAKNNLFASLNARLQREVKNLKVRVKLKLPDFTSTGRRAVLQG